MRNLNSQFVSYELAVELKSLGFDEECFASIDNFSKSPYIPSKGGRYKNSDGYGVACPLWQQAFTFLLRKLKNRELCAVLEFDGEVTLMEVITEDSYETYNKTLASGNKESLEKLIEIVKENK